MRKISHAGGILPQISKVQLWIFGYALSNEMLGISGDAAFFPNHSAFEELFIAAMKLTLEIKS